MIDKIMLNTQLIKLSVLNTANKEFIVNNGGKIMYWSIGRTVMTRGIN